MKTKDILKQMNEKEQEALFEMLERLQSHKITDWTFKMFLDGLIANIKER